MSKWLPLLLLFSALAGATPQRIVSLTPHITELLYLIGAGDRIVATDDASDTPPEARRLPHVANYRSINSEALLAQQPDLVVAWRSAQARMLEPVTRLGVPVFYSDPTDFASLSGEMRALGQLLGVTTQANAAADAFDARLTQLRERYSKKEPVRVFYQLWNPPLTSVSGIAWPAQAITLCGGNNVVGEAASPYPQIGMEEVLRANPQLIVAGSQHKAVLEHWRQWPMLEAVRRDALVLVNPDQLHRFTPRALNAVEALCQAIDAVRHR
ncbi:cobalamin-binding protein [Aeromonas simiae]|uniref:Cobalamin-binding protein n=1 Tax=Aeromonas simiae TaxID=218936 RepID=A0A5J6WYH1_9GAMM|nr:cobalamin-binding protein [Aeromonas simiae]QFI55137.1 cobalamin-binding protein [Aeromonas simiae]